MTIYRAVISNEQNDTLLINSTEISSQQRLNINSWIVSTTKIKQHKCRQTKSVMVIPLSWVIQCIF